MDIVAHARTVMCVVVVAEYSELGTLADSYLSDVRHEIVRNSVRVFADKTALVRSDGVEITEKNYVPFVVSLLDVGEYLLKHGFCPSVWVCAVTLRAFFGDRNERGLAVYCSG